MMPSYQWMNSHYKNKTVSSMSYLYIENPYIRMDDLFIEMGSAVSLNINIPYYKRNSHYKDKIVLQLCYLYNENPYICKDGLYTITWPWSWCCFQTDKVKVDEVSNGNKKFKETKNGVQINGELVSVSSWDPISIYRKTSNIWHTKS